MFTSHISMKSCDIFTEPRSTEWTFSSLFHIILCDYLSDGYLYLSLSLSLSLFISFSEGSVCVSNNVCVTVCVSPVCVTHDVYVYYYYCVCVTSMCVKRLHIRVSQCHSVCMTDSEGVSCTYLRILPLVPISYYSITSSHKLSQEYQWWITHSGGVSRSTVSDVSRANPSD